MSDNLLKNQIVGVHFQPDRGISCLAELANDTQARKQWTIKGIPPSAVDQTREAARRSGMKLNAWVTHALYRAVEEAKLEDQPTEPLPKNADERITDLETYIKESLADIRHRTEEIENSMKIINAFLVRMYTERK